MTFKIKLVSKDSPIKRRNVTKSGEVDVVTVDTRIPKKVPGK